MNVLGVT